MLKNMCVVVFGYGSCINLLLKHTTYKTYFQKLCLKMQLKSALSQVLQGAEVNVSKGYKRKLFFTAIDFILKNRNIENYLTKALME